MQINRALTFASRLDVRVQGRVFVRPSNSLGTFTLRMIKIYPERINLVFKSAKLTYVHINYILIFEWKRNACDHLLQKQRIYKEDGLV